jgi:hypothetical protein
LNSLKNDALPAPRKRLDFRFDRKWERDHLLQRAPDLDRHSENWLNAVLFKEHLCNTPLSWGKLVGYEIPLADETQGQLKVDLVGVGKEGNRTFFSLVELKRARNKTDSPLMALIEVICYAIQIIRSRDFLIQDLRLAAEGLCSRHDFREIRMVLAAPDKYWRNWILQEHVRKMGRIVTLVNETIASCGCQLSLYFYEIGPKRAIPLSFSTKLLVKNKS